MPAGTVAAHMEAKMRRHAKKKGMKGRRADNVVYGTMNKAGMMHGNKVTAKGMKHYAANRKMMKAY